MSERKEIRDEIESGVVTFGRGGSGRDFSLWWVLLSCFLGLAAVFPHSPSNTNKKQNSVYLVDHFAHLYFPNLDNKV